jgi:acetolactate synthase-1/2/3 large subunit
MAPTGTRLTGGEALAKALVREGVRVVFGLPGVQLYGAVAALRDEPGIRFVTTRHEQATTYMADGYARAGGEFGVALVVPGPGLLNAAAGLATAYAASSPVFLIAGQVPRSYLGRKVGVLHELDDQLEALRGVTKWRRSVLEASEVPRAVHDAVVQLKTGRPRPVAIDIPPDALEQEAEIELLPPAAPTRPPASAADVERAAEMLLRAERPLVYAGGGVLLSGAHEALAAVAEHLQAGVVQSAEGKGAVSDASDLSLGAALWRESPLRAHLDAADLVLAVGTRLAVAGLQPSQLVIQIDVDPEEIGRNHPKTFGLVGDANGTLEQGRAGGAAGTAGGGGARGGAAGGDPPEPAGRDARGHDHRARHDAGRLPLPAVLAGLPPADLPHVVLFREPRLRLPDGARRQGRLPPAAGGLALRRRRLPLQRP